MWSNNDWRYYLSGWHFVLGIHVLECSRCLRFVRKCYETCFGVKQESELAAMINECIRIKGYVAIDKKTPASTVVVPASLSEETAFYLRRSFDYLNENRGYSSEYLALSFYQRIVHSGDRVVVCFGLVALHLMKAL